MDCFRMQAWKMQKKTDISKNTEKSEFNEILRYFLSQM